MVTRQKLSMSTQLQPSPDAVYSSDNNQLQAIDIVHLNAPEATPPRRYPDCDIKFGSRSGFSSIYSNYLPNCTKLMHT